MRTRLRSEYGVLEIKLPRRELSRVDAGRVLSPHSIVWPPLWPEHCVQLQHSTLHFFFAPRLLEWAVYPPLQLRSLVLNSERFGVSIGGPERTMVAELGINDVGL